MQLPPPCPYKYVEWLCDASAHGSNIAADAMNNRCEAQKYSYAVERTQALAASLLLGLPDRRHLAIVALAHAARLERAHAVLGPEGAVAEEVDFKVAEVCGAGHGGQQW